MSRLTPLPHQKSGIKYLLRNHGGAIYSSPRSGKTLMVLRALESSQSLPALIICPNSVIASWYGALIEDEVPESEILVLSNQMKVSEMKHILLTDHKYVIINYEKLKTTDAIDFRLARLPILEIKNWKAIVLDESYRIASLMSGVSQYVMQTEYIEDQMRIVLTGTPICESVMDVVQPYIFTDGKFFGYSDPFAYRNRYYKQYGYDWKCKSPIHKQQVERFVKQNSFQVQLSDLGLGGVILTGLELLELSDYQKKLCKWVAMTSHYEIDGESRDMYAPIKTMFYQKIASGIHPLTNEIFDIRKSEHLGEIISSEKSRCLILTRFTRIIPSIKEVLSKYGIKAEIISGKTSLADRDSIRKSFQCGELDVVIAQVDSVARGLDFSSLDKIYYFNNSFSYEVRAQSELRGQNVKRKTPYSVVDLCFKDSIDTEIRNCLQQKHSDVSNFIKEISDKMKEHWLSTLE